MYMGLLTFLAVLLEFLLVFFQLPQFATSIWHTLLVISKLTFCIIFWFVSFVFIRLITNTLIHTFSYFSVSSFFVPVGKTKQTHLKYDGKTKQTHLKYDGKTKQTHLKYDGKTKQTHWKNDIFQKCIDIYRTLTYSQDTH